MLERLVDDLVGEVVAGAGALGRVVAHVLEDGEEDETRHLRLLLLALILEKQINNYGNETREKYMVINKA